MDTDNETWYLIDNLLVMLLWNVHLGLLLKALLIILHSTLRSFFEGYIFVWNLFQIHHLRVLSLIFYKNKRIIKEKISNNNKKDENFIYTRLQCLLFLFLVSFRKMYFLYIFPFNKMFYIILIYNLPITTKKNPTLRTIKYKKLSIHTQTMDRQSLFKLTIPKNLSYFLFITVFDYNTNFLLGLPRERCKIFFEKWNKKVDKLNKED